MKTTEGISLQNKVHLPHPTRQVTNNLGRDPRPTPACGQRSSRFIPSRTIGEVEVTCLKCEQLALNVEWDGILDR